MRATEWPCRSRVLRLMGLWSGQHHVVRAILASLPQQHLRRHRRRRVRERWWARWRALYWLRVVERMDREARQEAAARRFVDAVFAPRIGGIVVPPDVRETLTSGH